MVQQKKKKKKRLEANNKRHLPVTGYKCTRVISGTICFWPIAWLVGCGFDLIPVCIRFWLVTDRGYPILVMAPQKTSCLLTVPGIPTLAYRVSDSCGFFAVHTHRFRHLCRRSHVHTASNSTQSPGRPAGRPNQPPKYLFWPLYCLFIIFWSLYLTAITIIIS